MSLADKIVEHNARPNMDEEADEFGIVPPTPCTPDYLVARALLINEQALADDEPRIHGLHLRDDTIFRWHSPIAENRRTMLELTRLKRNVKAWEEVEFWRLLKKYLPRLNRRILEIAPDLYWDIDKAELINRKQAEERSKR